MESLRLLSAADTATAGRIIDLAHELLLERPWNGVHIDGLKDAIAENDTGTGRYCRETSDAVVRAAHRLGVVASREIHDLQYHCIASFAPLEQLPTDDDPILCLTWGQFDRRRFTDVGLPFFGRRRDIAALVGHQTYGAAFSPRNISKRQITYTPAASDPAGYFQWLNTTPEQIAGGRYPLGQVDRHLYPERCWMACYS